MCEVCNREFKKTMIKILNEAREINKEMNDEEFEEYIKTSEFTEYAKKRIPEIVAETSIFSVFKRTDQGNYEYIGNE